MRLLSIRTKDSTKKSAGGYILPALLGFIIAMGLISTALLMVIVDNFMSVDSNVKSQQAFNVAEAGINYYLWHMAHNSTDFRDGTSLPASPDAQLGYGPYVHDYIDSNAVKQGTYTLWIKPQGAGSTIATVRSIGKSKNSNIPRTIDAQIGATSFASYALVADGEFWFGDSEAANGPVFSNQGVHMDGVSTDTVGAANATYVAGNSYGGNGSSKPGVWCNTSVITPVNCTTRDKTNWLYPQSSIDFNQVSTSLCTMKKVAFANDAATASIAGQANACSQVPTTRTAAYIPRNGTTFNLTKGYLVQLNNNSTYDLYKVNSENDLATTYSAALSPQVVATGIALPSSGVLFVEDNVWVRTNPTFKGRLSIAAGQLASNSSADINIADDVLYSTKNGTDEIGLIAENDVLVAPYAPPSTGSFTFEVDAAALAQSGSVTYPSNYKASTSRCTRGWVNSNQKFVYYGSVATRQAWTWNYLLGGSCGDAVYDGSRYVSGIKNTATNYDYNLLYAPPPSYPITGGYNILSWREVLTKP